MKLVQITHGRVNPDGDNGISRTVYNINKYIGNDIDNEIYSFDERVDKNERFERECGLQVELFPRKIFGISQEFKDKISTDKDCLYHFHLMWMIDKNFLAKEILAKKRNYIVTTHAAYTPDRIDSLKKKIAISSFELEFLKNAKAIHALCEEEKYILRELGLKNDIFVLPNGISDVEIDKIKQSDSMASPYDSSKFNIVWVGRVRPDKNILGMVKAISLLPETCKKHIIFNIVGSYVKNYVEEVKELISNLGLESSVILHGPKFDIEKYNFIKKADLYLQPSFSEGISFSILDALACGVPTVISRQCNMNYYIKHNAFEVIEPFAEDISNKIVELYENKEQRETLSINALKLVKNTFYWGSLISSYKENYIRIKNA
jgi:glycosyltransferase involved in cell wall biosynthesis